MKEIILLEDYRGLSTGNTAILDDRTAEKFVIDGIAIMSKDLGEYPNKMVSNYERK